MTFKQMRDILQHVEQIHYQAAECCARARDSADERLNLLADFFRQWERRLGSYLDSLQREQRQAFLNTWVQYAPTEDIDHALDAICREHAETSETLIGRAFDLQHKVPKLMEQLADRLNVPEVRQRLLDLAKVERKAAKDLSVADVMRRDI